MDQTDEEIRQGRVEGAIELLVEVQLEHFTVEDLRRLRHLLEMEIALRD